jgi:hypothetical protein
MDREYDNRLDRPSAIRSGNATMRQCLNDAAKAVKQGDWYMAVSRYSALEELASSLRCSAEANMERANDQ